MGTEASVGLIGGIVMIISIASIVCWIMEIVAAFKKEESPLMGILSIVLCTLGGFIIGWVKAKEWGIQKLMTTWTVIVLVLVVLQGVSFFVLGTQAKGQFDQINIEQMQQDLEQQMEDAEAPTEP